MSDLNKAQVAVAGILAAGLLLTFALSDYSQRQRIEESDGRARANVTGGEVIQLFSLPPSHRLTVEYGPIVTFRVPKRFYYFAQEQGFVTVRYISEDPFTAVIKGVGPFYPTLFTVAGILIAGSVCVGLGRCSTFSTGKGRGYRRTLEHSVRYGEGF